MTTTSFASQSPSIGVRDGELLDKYQRTADLPTESQLGEALRILRYELDLYGYERRRRVLDRLHTLLAMDRHSARRLALTFEECIATLEPSERAEIDGHGCYEPPDRPSQSRNRHRMSRLQPCEQPWPEQEEHYHFSRHRQRPQYACRL